MSSTKASMRKRSRPQLQDKDELSPAPTESPLSSVKRRKLNTNASSPSKPKASGALKRLGTLFGLGATKENSRDDREAIDELADSDEDNAKSEEVPKPVAKRGRPPRKEDSSPEKQARPGKRAMLNKAKALSRQAARARLEAAAQEAEESKATTSSDTRSQTNRRTQSIRDSEGIPDSDTGTLKGILTPSKKKPGRPRKSVAFENGNARDELDLGFKDLPASSSTVRKDTPGSKKRGPKGKELRDAKTLEDQEEVRQTKSIYDFEVSDEEPPVINKSKNITPKVKVGRTAKVASVDETDVEEIPEVTKTKKIAPKSNHSLVNAFDEESDVEPDGDVEEDVTCLICTEAHSKKPNMILFCDGCDLAVHQKCYDVPVIPKGDWFCIDCAPQNSEDGSVQIVTEVVTDIGTHLDLAKDLPDIEDFEHHLCITQRLVLDKLTGHKPIKLRGHDDEMQKVYQVIEQTVLAGEGNSMLVIGARGCGKTTLVESVISDIATEHRDSFHVIRLNGFIHTDDKLALREIWRQLGREMEVEEDSIGKSNNYADTLASLLALLSHPSEISQGEEDQTSKSVIFILDEFDLFTTHPRQTLLYNLFDIAQAKKAPIAVLGLTTRIDVMESLEKRVKSRFSHRYVHISLPRSLPAFWDICKDGLLVNIEELRSDGRNIGTAGWDEFQSYWQTMIEELYNSDAAFKQHLHSHFYRTKSVPAFFTSCILAVANLSTSKFPLIGKDFVSTSLSAPDSKLHILQGLSDLELALLISAARLDIILDTDTCNFAMAYDEYSTLTSRHKIQTSSTGATALGSSAKVWGREVSLGAWERLAEYGLLIPASMGREAGINSSIGGRMWKVDIGLEEISGSVDGLSTVMSKWCREI